MTPADYISEILKKLASMCEVGTKLTDLDIVADAWLEKRGLATCNKGYHPQWAKSPYPAYICTSVNDVITHGIPTAYKLKDGDIVTIDMGLALNNQCADAALTVGVGNVENKNERLIRFTRRACYIGIQQVKAGAKISEIGKAIQRYATTMGYTVNKMWAGHDIGKTMHGTYMIPMFDPSGDPQFKEHILEEGEIICIEPHLTRGKETIGTPMEDGWGWKTRDGKEVAMFEHMVRVEKDGFTILTSHFEEPYPVLY